MTELVARLHGDGAGVRMQVVLDRLTWPLRKLGWKVEERLLWPLGDLLRRTPKSARIEPSEIETGAPETIQITTTVATEVGSDPAGWPASPTADAPGAATSRKPLRARITAPLRELSVVLGTIVVAIGIGIGVATILGGSDDTAKVPRASAPSVASPAPAAAPAAPGGPATLHGVSPSFKASQDSAAVGAAGTQASPLARTNSKPSSIPAGVSDNKEAIKTARAFSGAFVLYEIGQTDAKVRKTLRKTATPSLARALEDRPPRLPAEVDVPTAKVQNIVLGTPQGRKLDASVSLLRLGTISELRLTLTKTRDGWAVSEVRG